ncbi:hypothetical protein AcV5_003538 [Taiwanofungus camphoratus]|nr:hypothetical protein AcV5_003538 [Antrodia cinnamomea]
MSCVVAAQIHPVLEIKIIPTQVAHKNDSRSRSPPRADCLLSMIRSLTVDDDYFTRRALRATCIQRSPLDDFHPQASEIVPGLFVCDAYTASSPAIIDGLGITHVASVLKRAWYQYPREIEHICIPIDDTRQASLLGYLDHTMAWMQDALRRKGRVMVHCVWGMSRSASVAIAYLMVTEHMSLEDALKLVKSKRQVVRPNSGFLAQLKVYEKVLRAREKRRRECERMFDTIKLYDD